ncbi:MAG TPA: error-prone DNA polymerase, partial [Chloroflexi bacterium]|nr:error-prone DNA polymerase [Chloroflexota bacterium]
AQGRGSAANSLVAYVLDITKVDPLRYNFLFERFLNPEGSSTPDIDIDFSTNHREEVISYVYERYGQDHTGMVCTYYTFKARQAIRDVGKALGFPQGVLDRLAKSVDRWAEDLSEHIIEEMGLKGMERSLPWRKFISLCNQIMHYPRHLGIHVGGMAITSQPLVELVPLERATMPGRVVTQYDKEWIEEVGLIKIDLLSLRTLSLVHDALEMIEENHGIRIDPEKVPLDDPLVFETLKKGDSIGMFQVESRAQRNTLPRLLPEKFEDLIVEVALIRPGPLQGNMVHPYLRRRQGREKITYLHPSLKPILEDTMGIIVFQEQVMQVAMAIAGFSAAEADSLRRAMSSKRSRWEMEKLRQRFMEGARLKGVEEKVATEIFRQIAGFAEFGFCRSHAAAFAQTAYLTAWLKIHYPAEFYCALLNNQPMGFYHVSVVTNDAKRHGVEILPVDINRSGEKCTTEEGNVRIGLTYVHGLGEKAARLIVEERDNGPYGSLLDLYRKTRLKRRPLENLIMVGAMDSWQTARRELLWELGMIYDGGDERKGQRRLELVFPSQRVKLSSLSRLQETVLDYTILGLTTSDHQHPMCFFRGWLKERGVASTAEIEELPHNQRVRIAGLVVVKQSPATAGDLLFVTLEDEFGLVDVIVWPHVWKRNRRLIQRAAILMVEGTLQKQGKVVSILAKRLEQIEEVPVEQREVSRNFR